MGLVNTWDLPEWALTSLGVTFLALLWSSWWARDRRRPLAPRRPPTAPLPPIQATYTRTNRKELSE